MLFASLTLSRRSFLLYRNQSIDLACKSMDWFLYDKDYRHKRVKIFGQFFLFNISILSLCYHLCFCICKSSDPEVFCKKDVLRNFVKLTERHLCQSLFLKKETLAQMFSCKFCKISKNTFYCRTPLMAASVFVSIFAG